jgi:transposase InsO family protein
MRIPRNAANESFFGTLKAEFFRFTEFDSIEQLDEVCINTFVIITTMSG